MTPKSLLIIANLAACLLCPVGAFAQVKPLEGVAALNNEGVKKLKARNYKGAVKDFNAALQIQPDYEIGIRNKFIAYDKMKDYEAMIKDFEDLQQMHFFNQNSVYMSQVGDAYAHQGLARQKAGDFQGALESFDKANICSPGIREYLHYRGVMRKATGDAEGAEVDFMLEKQSESLKSRYH